MGKCNICTIHSFCLDVIKNNFYEIDVSPNFRIADQTEVELLKQEVLENLFEQKYEEDNEEFLKLINTYTGYRGDEPLKELILKVYRYIGASPFPNEWLDEQIQKFNLGDKLEEDFINTVWGKILIHELREELNSYIIELKSVRADLEKFIELDKFSKIVSQDIENLEKLNCNLDSWDKAYNIAKDIDWEIWPRDSKIVLEQKEIAKEKRNAIKGKFNKLKDKVLLYDSKQANEDINTMYEVISAIGNIVKEFSIKYQEAKKEKNILDFNDIEHFALKILIKKDGKSYVPTKVAKSYMEKFSEIAIDEYQDSNLVQEYILNAISRGNNIFMVGDVKQSIYKFRQARPELFLEKYEKYKTSDDKKKEDNLKIQLFKNFRSRKNVLDITNLVFESIMSKELGDINYNEEEYLNLGANYDEPKTDINYAGNTELNIINLKQIEEEHEELKDIENATLEARFVANRIKELIDSKYQVFEKDKGYRNVTFKDIVILLRATSNLAPIYEKELNDLKLPVFSDIGSGYLDSIEIQTIMSILKIIDNPMQDIPLIAFLRSPIVGFDDNELISIKLNGHKKEQNYFYEALVEASKNEKLEISKKIVEVLDRLEEWRKKQEYLTLDELIWQIYLDTGYYNYVSLMPNGNLRQANLKMLFEKAKEYESASFKGLFNFINFIDKLKTNSGDMDSAKVIGENENVIRIMSIHKSKGLEFPVVFLASTGKKFNMQDLNDNILLHQDIGIGPKYIDYERRIEYNTLAKVAIGYKTKVETLSEEMRVLYVALTRAKEKLIITGLSKDFKKEKQNMQEILDTYEDRKIPANILKNYNSYLEWLELVYLKNKDISKDVITLKEYEKEELVKRWDDTKEKEDSKSINKIEELSDKNEEIEKLLNWKYKNIESSKIPAKTSVTKIKEMENQNIDFIFNESKKYDKENLAKPKFLKDEIEITKAQIGTLTHLCLQKIDEKQDYTYEKLQSEILKLVQNEIITQEEAKSIDVNKLLEYTKSDLFKDVKQAREIYKEQAFYTSIKASDVYDKNVDDRILVQGVIDLYYIDKDGNIVLVDYKTDYVKENEQELVEKYKKQLEIYKKALEDALEKEVYKTYIYSVYLGKSIEIEL